VCIEQGTKSTTTHQRDVGERQVFQCDQNHAFDITPDRVQAWRTRSNIWAAIKGDPWTITSHRTLAAMGEL
jgi:hypothetical protein